MSWYAVMCQSRSEAMADRLLRQQGFETFFPHTAAWEPKDRRKLDLVKTALLPRYIFVKLGEQTPEFWRVNETPGVSTVIYAPGGIPWAVPQKAIDILAEKCLPCGLMMQTPKRVESFAGKRGDWVRLAETTPYFGFMCEILGVDTDGRIAIALESFGRTIPVVVKARDVSELIPKQKIAG